MFNVYPQPILPISTNAIDEALEKFRDSPWIGNVHPGVKEYKVYDIPEDLLALSVAWHRIRSTGVKIVPGITRLLDSELFKQVVEEDRMEADNIRDYYSKKIMMWKLQEQRFTKYREDLNIFIHSDKKRGHQERMFGLAYRLPEMHLFDGRMDKLRLDIESIPNNQSPLQVNMDWVLVPNRELIFKTKLSNTHQFWFKNSDGYGVLLKVSGNQDQLLPTWKKLFDGSKYMHIRGISRKKTRDGFSYIQLDRWQCEKFELK